MASIVLLSGLFAGAIATGLVFADATRRGLPPRTRSLWTGGVGIVSIGGFLAVYLLYDHLYRLYLDATGSPAVAPLPKQTATVLLVAGLAASAVAVLAYGFGSRFGPLEAAERGVGDR